MKGHFRTLITAAGVAISIGALTPAQAAVIQLGFILDRSGSIGSDFSIMRAGLSTAMGLLPVDGASANTYEVSVVSFADNASIDINKFHVVTAANRTALQALVLSSLPASGSGLTDYAAAFSTMQSALSGSTNSPILSYVNFGTDGDPTDGGSIGTSNNQAGINARNALIGAGVDNISIEGISISAASASNLQTNYCYPAPCEIGSATQFDSKGFYFGVNGAAGYATTIQNKIRIVTNQTPEPGSLALLGLALAGLGFARRKKAAA